MKKLTTKDIAKMQYTSYTYKMYEAIDALNFYAAHIRGVAMKDRLTPKGMSTVSRELGEHLKKVDKARRNWNAFNKAYCK
jgi:hypothetical protein